MKIVDDLFGFIWTNPTANNCNAYLINGERKILVDPGHYHLFGHVREHLEKLSLTLDDIDMVFVTHCHPDHMEGVRLFSETSAIIALSQTEMEYIRTTAPHYGDALGISDFEPNIFLQEGALEIGTMNFVDPAATTNILDKFTAWLAEHDEDARSIVGTLQT